MIKESVEWYVRVVQGSHAYIFKHSLQPCITDKKRIVIKKHCSLFRGLPKVTLVGKVF